jgi:hypothetical protein
MMLLRFLHIIGIALWLGAGVVGLLFAVGARQDTPMRVPRLLLLSRVYSLVIAPGAMLATATGIALTMTAMSAGFGAALGSPPLAAMQALGLVAGLLEVFVAFPTAQRLAGFAAATLDGAAWGGEALRRRLVGLVSVTLSLVVVATYLGMRG